MCKYRGNRKARVYVLGRALIKVLQRPLRGVITMRRSVVENARNDSDGNSSTINRASFAKVSAQLPTYPL